MSDLPFACPECRAGYYGRLAADACCPSPRPGVRVTDE